MTAPDPIGARTWHEADGLHVDVRGLPPPQPLVLVLRLIDGPQAPPVVILHHDREPRLLYPELAERGWQASHLAGDPGEVRLRLEPFVP
ncbi:DUF2249 domain-containing protein [Aquabacterium humicola]|uniref:DUF2249 domain-containing protein n=1 Tax=Aquabacterium humicola TaxID=3237377 RepID=UPI00254328B5|nr:DUF2249 domain-containing protein [Rubrivivax pictus]